jgi:hypothetical protein
MTLEEISRLPIDARAPALLQWLLRALARQQLMKPDRALTNSELANRLPASSASDFRRFIRCVEPALYGGIPLQEEGFAQAQTLASRLAEPRSNQGPREGIA